ncbi:MAG: hypothetical protein A2020_14305 [Lentisphaerae bacterium GWF2_45_14]|nr:MAG: hypothetical protein A2020_14305 [Lentisphaerae bacterium GWF2_45_14]
MNNLQNKAKSLISEMRSCGNLPALSENVRDISKVARMKNTCAIDLASVIMRDPGLSSNILAEANSSYYSARYPIKTITMAVTFLGFERVYSIALGLSLFNQTMKSAKSQKLSHLYASSYFSGTFAMSFARGMNHPQSEEIFVAGLLFRLPWIALANTFPQKFQEMEKLIRTNSFSYDKACLKVFDVEYQELCLGLVEIYHLPPNVADVILGKPEIGGQIATIIREAGNISNMLFGDKLGGAEAISEVNQRMTDLFKRNFSLPDFIKETCNTDPNMTRFFKLDKSDVDMMVNALEWGKGNPVLITARMSYDAQPEAKNVQENEDPERLVGHFLTELIMGCRKNTDLNQMLMMAQEALYKCLKSPEVFTCFFNRQKTILSGRFYVGNRMDLSAEDFFINVNHSDSPVIISLQTQKQGCWEILSNQSLHLPALKRHLNLKSAIFSPVMVLGKAIGLYFVGRTNDTPFNDREKLWLEQIVSYISTAFETSRKTSSEFMSQEST